MNRIEWDEKVKEIRPGSIVLVWGDSWLSKIIKWYQKWETGEDNTPSHVEMYWGGGDRMTVSAEWNGVRKMSLDRYFGTKHKLEVYHYKNLKVEEFQIMRAYNLGTVGRMYDYKGLLSFLSNIKVIYNLFKKKITPDDYMDFCSENCAAAYEQVEIKVAKKDKSGEINPANIWQYIRDAVKWEKSYEYNNLA